MQGELQEAARILDAAGCQTPRLDAELLLAEVLGVERAWLLIHSRQAMSGRQADAFHGLLRRRAAREPVAYILGRRAFRRLELEIDDRVLVPRPETELLVEVALALPPGASVADVGTGSGAVALALADERPDLRISGIDSSEAALAVARANAARLGLDVRLVRGDLLDDRNYDAVLANLPYVAEGERDLLPPEVRDWEPPAALFAGEDGLVAMRRLTRRLRERPKGLPFVALEIGATQGDAVAGLLRAHGYASVERHRDLAGHERVVVGRTT